MPPKSPRNVQPCGMVQHLCVLPGAEPKVCVTYNHHQVNKFNLNTALYRRERKGDRGCEKRPGNAK